MKELGNEGIKEFRNEVYEFMLCNPYLFTALLGIFAV
jgi:hypothetical protein